MAQQKINGNPIYFGDIRKEPDVGRVRYGGNIRSTRFTASTLQKNPVSSDYNLKVSSGMGVAKPLSNATFNYMAAAKYIVRRLTTTIAGVSNTVLISGAAFPNTHGQHPNVHVRGTILTQLQWSRSAGHDLPVYTATVDNVETTFSADHDATPTVTLSAPGTLTYRTGKPLPKEDNYKAKTNG